jgi:threonine synthase
MGATIALEELIKSKLIKRFPKIIAVQTKNCAPIYEAYKKRESIPVPISPKKTIAEGIAIAKPLRGKQILEYIYQYDMEVVAVEEDSILFAQSQLAEKGIFVEPTSAANLAGYYKYNKEKEIKGDTVIMISGAGIKATD